MPSTLYCFPLPHIVSHAGKLLDWFLARIGGDCTTPLAAFAELEDRSGGARRLRVRGLLCSPDGAEVVRHEVSGDASRAELLGAEVAEVVLEKGGAEILQQLEESCQLPQASSSRSVVVTTDAAAAVEDDRQRKLPPSNSC